MLLRGRLVSKWWVITGPCCAQKGLWWPILKLYLAHMGPYKPTWDRPGPRQYAKTTSEITFFLFFLFWITSAQCTCPQDLHRTYVSLLCWPMLIPCLHPRSPRFSFLWIVCSKISARRSSAPCIFRHHVCWNNTMSRDFIHRLDALADGWNMGQG